MPERLTITAHRLVSEVLTPGSIAVDATTGNGYDTLFLARTVGPTGHVFGFDIQRNALTNTEQRLIAAGLMQQTTLFHEGHEMMKEFLPSHYRGRVMAIMFNLGYLPGSDKRVTTTAENTIQALAAGLDLLAEGGIISILSYRHHEGGEEEFYRLGVWLEKIITRNHEVTRIDSPGPTLFIIRAGKKQ